MEGAAQEIAWLDPRSLGVIRLTDSTMWLDVIDLDGRLVSSVDIGWGFGGASVNGRLLRVLDDGLQAVDRNGTIQALVPQRPGTFGDKLLSAMRHGFGGHVETPQ